jgi:hypothetical protein
MSGDPGGSHRTADALALSVPDPRLGIWRSPRGSKDVEDSKDMEDR